MVFLGRTSKVRSLVKSNWVLSPLAIAYGVFLYQSWTPDTWQLMFPGDLMEGLSGGFNPQYMPRLPDIMKLFSRPAVAESAWLHLLVINLVAARFIFWDSIRERLPAVHSLLLSAVAGPLGLVLHFLTKGTVKLIEAVLGKRSGDDGETIIRYRSGSIIILPTQENSG